jgi:hypothetical protein
MSTVTTERVVQVAADLMSEDGENPEYDRACVEIVRDLLGMDWEDDTRSVIEAALRATKESGTIKVRSALPDFLGDLCPWVRP